MNVLEFCILDVQYTLLDSDRPLATHCKYPQIFTSGGCSSTILFKASLLLQYLAVTRISLSSPTCFTIAARTLPFWLRIIYHPCWRSITRSTAPGCKWMASPGSAGTLRRGFSYDEYGSCRSHSLAPKLRTSWYENFRIWERMEKSWWLLLLCRTWLLNSFLQGFKFSSSSMFLFAPIKFHESHQAVHKKVWKRFFFRLSYPLFFFFFFSLSHTCLFSFKLACEEELYTLLSTFEQSKKEYRIKRVMRTEEGYNTWTVQSAYLHAFALNQPITFTFPRVSGFGLLIFRSGFCSLWFPASQSCFSPRTSWALLARGFERFAWCTEDCLWHGCEMSGGGGRAGALWRFFGKGLFWGTPREQGLGRREICKKVREILQKDDISKSSTKPFFKNLSRTQISKPPCQLLRNPPSYLAFFFFLQTASFSSQLHSYSISYGVYESLDRCFALHHILPYVLRWRQI